MAKKFQFNFKLDEDDRVLLLRLSLRLRRSQSDTVRWLIHLAHDLMVRGELPSHWDFGDPESLESAGTEER